MPLTPIDPLIAPLLSKRPLTDVDRVKLWEALKRLSNSLYNPEKSDVFNNELFINKINEVIESGAIIQINGEEMSSLVNFNDLTPQVPSEGHSNVFWQKDPDNIHASAYVPDREDIKFFGSTLLGVSGAAQATTLDFNPSSITSNTVEFVMPVGGWFRNLHAYISVDNGPSTGMIYVKLDSNIANVMKVSIPPNMAIGVSGTIRSSLRMEQGETFRFSFVVLGSSNINASLSSVSLEYAADDGSVVIGNSQAPAFNMGASSTLYYHPGTSYQSTLRRDNELIIPFAGTLRNMILQKNVAQPASGSLVATVLNNGVDTIVEIDVPLSGEFGYWADFVNDISVAAGDKVTVRGVNSATGISRWNVSTFTILPANSAKTSILSGHFGLTALASGATLSSGPFSGTPSATLIRNNFAVTRPGILSNFYQHAGSSGGVSPMVDFTIYVNDVATILTANVPREHVFVDTGAVTIDVNAAARTYSGTFGGSFEVGASITASGFTNGGNNAAWEIESIVTVLGVTTITVVGGGTLVNESGDGDEQIEQMTGWVSDLTHEVTVERGDLVRNVAVAEVYGTTTAIRQWSCEFAEVV